MVSEDQRDVLVAFVKKRLPNSKILVSAGTTVTCGVPRTLANLMPNFFTEIEAAMAAGEVRIGGVPAVAEFSISNSTLEEVFLKLTQEDRAKFSLAGGEVDEEVSICCLCCCEEATCVWAFTKGGAAFLVDGVICRGCAEGRTEEGRAKREELLLGSDAGDEKVRGSADEEDTRGELRVLDVGAAQRTDVENSAEGDPTTGVPENAVIEGQHAMVPVKGLRDGRVPASDVDTSAVDTSTVGGRGVVLEGQHAISSGEAAPLSSGEAGRRAPVHRQFVGIFFKNFQIQKKQRLTNLCNCCCLISLIIASILVGTMTKTEGWAVSKNLSVVQHAHTGLMVPAALAGVSGPLFRTLFQATTLWPSGFTARDAAQVAVLGAEGWAAATSTLGREQS